MNNIKYLIPEVKLTSAEKHLVDFINNNPEFFIKNKITDISKKSNTSTSCITRLAKKLNFNNLKEFQIKIANDLNYVKQNIKFKKDDCLENHINNLKLFHLYSIKETLDSIDLEVLKKLLVKINNSRKILLYGVGSSYLACHELAFNLEKIGYNTITNRDFHHILLQISNLNKNDLVIIVSKTGYSAEINFLINKLNNLNIEIALITTSLKSKNKVNYLINFKTYEQKKRITAISSKVAQLVIVDLIYIEIFNLKHNLNEEKINLSNNIIKEWNKN